MPADTLLEMRGITKSFPGVQALAGVDFDVRRGEVHAVVGHNGAGKSTLIKILTGAYPKDGGHIVLGGQEVSFHTPAAAQAAGIATIYQEVNLVPHLSVAENICLGRQPTRFGVVRWRAMARRAQGFDLRISYTDIRAFDDLDYRYEPELEALARDSDFLIAIE